MNQDRRAKIEAAVEELRSALETMQELHATLESLKDEEQEALSMLISLTKLPITHWHFVTRCWR
jgi:formiminotetrahydrofolate cyclodeaminase